MKKTFAEIAITIAIFIPIFIIGYLVGLQLDKIGF